MKKQRQGRRGAIGLIFAMLIMLLGCRTSAPESVYVTDKHAGSQTVDSSYAHSDETAGISPEGPQPESTPAADTENSGGSEDSGGPKDTQTTKGSESPGEPDDTEAPEDTGTPDGSGIPGGDFDGSGSSDETGEPATTAPPTPHKRLAVPILAFFRYAALLSGAVLRLFQGVLIA